LKQLNFIVLFAVLINFSFPLNAQEEKKINIVYGANYTRNETKFPGASIFTKDTRQVQIEHQGIDLWCDVAVYYQKENRIKALGNVFFQQGDSIKMNGGYIEYDGNTKIAYARDKVVLRNSDMALATDTLYFDRNLQEAYYNSFGTIKDTINVLTSNKGRYYLTSKKYQFLSNVTITHPDYTLNSAQLDYYTTTKHAYMYGASTITGKEYKVYCERGFYDTKNETGYFVKKSRIDYNNRIIHGDSLYFEKNTNFASATNHIKVIDTINKTVVKGHYAEVFKAKDSVFITKRAVFINVMEQDSMYVHGDTLMVTGKPEERIIRAFHNAKFYTSDLSGKCDSIHANQKTGLTQLIKRPIIWSGEKQMTGDSIYLISNAKTESLDSLKVINNAFIIEKDTLSEGFNQVKGKNLYGLFKNNKLHTADIVKNSEVIYYIYNDKQELVGIDKSVCGAIRLTVNENEIQDITFFTDVDGDVFPDKELPKNARKLKGFVWYGDEMIRSKDAIFDENDNNIQLAKIRGIDNTLSIETEEAEYQKQDTLEKQKKPSPSTVPFKKKRQ
jgi:lipopolysaccharide export system protein LptA